MAGKSAARSTIPSPWPPHSSGSARPAQPSSAISFQPLSSKPLSLAAISRSRSDLKREARRSWAVDLIACCSSVRSKYMGEWAPSDSLAQPRQAQDPLGDDVFEDVGGAALDRVGAGAEEAVLPGAAGDRMLGAACQRRVSALDLERQLGQVLVDVGPLPLAQRALGTGDARLHRLGQAAVGVQPHRLDLDVELGDALAEVGILGGGGTIGGRFPGQLREPAE